MENSWIADLNHLEILRAIWRRRKLLVSGIFICLATSFLVVIYFTNQPAYVSKATIALEPSVLDKMPQFMEFAKRDNNVNTLLVLLRSQSFAEAVVEGLPRESAEELITRPQYTDYELALKNRIKGWLRMQPTMYSPQERAVTELQNARIEFVPTQYLPHILTVAGSASNPRVAMDLVNAYLQTLLARTRSASQAEVLKGKELLEAQLQKAKESQVQAEETLARYQQKKGQVFLPEEATMGIDRLSHSEGALIEAEASREVVLAKIAFHRQLLGQARVKGTGGSEQVQGVGRDEMTVPSPISEDLPRIHAFRAAQAQLDKLEEKLAALRERYTEAHPLVQTTQQEVVNVRARVTQLGRGLPDMSLTKEPRGPRVTPVPASDLARTQQQLVSLEAEDRALQAKIDVLKMQANNQRKSLRNVSEDAVNINNLRRTVEVNRNLVTVLTDKLTAAQAIEQRIDGAVRIVVPASYPVRPTKSQSKKLVGIALLLAGCLALGLPYGIEAWRLPVETETDVQKATGLPLLGSVSIIKRPRATWKTSRFGQLPPLQISPPYSSGDARIHLELYRAIRANIETERLKAPFRSILVNSPGPDEGKSTTVLNLAHVFQEFGRRVLIVEADLRRPRLCRTLSLAGKPGLPEFLNGTATFEQVCRVLPSGVTVIPGHVTRGDLGSILASPRLKEILNSTNPRFDLILIDSPPMLAVPDNLMLVASVDRVILVAKASTTSIRELRKAHRALQRADARFLGVVLNQANPRDVDYYHPRYRKYYQTDDPKRAAEDPSGLAAQKK